MSDHDVFLRYLEIQGDTDLLTKTELLEAVRGSGGRISERTLSYYTTQGLIPRAVRIGSRAGAYPKVVAELLRWVIRARDRGVSVDAIRELLPVWQHIVSACRHQHVDLAELQYIARERVRIPEANFEIPWLLDEAFRSFCPQCATDVTWVLKNGEQRTRGDEFKVGFILAELDEAQGVGRPVAWMQLVLPGLGMPDEDDPGTVILGIPNTVPLHRAEQRVVLSDRRPHHHEAVAPDGREEASTHG